MALSKPILGIQSPIQCQLCEKDPKISWKCLECDLLMCSACKNNIHPKIKTAGEHRILDIKDIGSKSSPGKDTGRTSPSSQDPTNVDITLVGEYQTKTEGVYQLAISLDDSLWISDGELKKGIRLFSSYTGLQKAKCEGDKLKVVSNFNIHVLGKAITSGNDLLIASDETILKQIKSGTNKIVDTVYNVDPYYPWSIYVTSTNKVIVGGFKKEEEDKITGIVIVMDHEGNYEEVYGEDQYGEDQYGEDQTKGISFTCPWRITGTNNEHIFVVDAISNRYEGRVVVLGQEGIINTYTGHPAINTEDIPFTPSDLTTTPADNVIVVDTDNCVLHILNSSGNLITYLSTEDKGIEGYPFSIRLAMAGQFCMLYLGTLPEIDSKNKAKLYKLSLLGC